MNLYFDTEFTGLHKDTSLISIGIVADNGERFYAEISDYDRTQLNEWLRKNVISNLLINKLGRGSTFNYPPFYCHGTKEQVGKRLLMWLQRFDKVQWVSDVAHYDFVLLVDLIYGDALSIPENHSKVCIDINRDIATYYKITEDEAFDMTRENIINTSMIPMDEEKHNALWDAYVIRAIYEKISR